MVGDAQHLIFEIVIVIIQASVVKLLGTYQQK